MSTKPPRITALLLFAAAVCLSANASAETLRIGGTGTALGTMRLLGEAYARTHKAVSIEVLPSLGSGGGIKAVLAGAIDLAVSTRDLKDDERAQGLSARIYGKTALVFATVRSTVASNITSAELVAMFGGTQTTWPDGHPVRPVLRPKAETDTQLAEEHISGMREALENARTRPAVPVQYTDQEAADALERIPGSLGTAALPVILAERRGLKVLALDGHVATPQSIADGTYPITKTCYFVMPAQPSAAVKEFLAFVYSPAGQAILEKNGHQALSGSAN